MSIFDFLSSTFNSLKYRLKFFRQICSSFQQIGSDSLNRIVSAYRDADTIRFRDRHPDCENPCGLEDKAVEPKIRIEEKYEAQGKKEIPADRSRQLLYNINENQEETVGFKAIETETDLFSLFSGLLALKNEVRLESRQFKNALDQFRSVLDLLRSGHEAALLEQAARRQEMTEIKRIAITPIIMDILDIRDRIEAGIRLIKSKKPSLIKRIFRKKNELSGTFLEGQEMMLNRMDGMLLSNGVTPIDYVGRIMDPHLMKAIEIERLPGKEDGMVTEEIRKGFMMDGKVLRPADVKVNRINE